MPLLHVSPPSIKRTRRSLHKVMVEDEEDDIGREKDDDWVAAQDALKLVRDPTVNTQAPLDVEQLVWQRISR